MRPHTRSTVSLRICCFSLAGICLSLGSRAGQLEVCTLNRKVQIFAMMTSVDLENIDLGSPNLYPKELLYALNFPLNFVFLALMGAEIEDGVLSAPSPSRACNFQTLSRESSA